MVFEHEREYGSQWATIGSIAERRDLKYPVRSGRNDE
jgi:hypothetical protein